MLKVLLIALSGFGNEAIKALKEDKVEIIGLFTRKEKGLFPYYPEENIIKLARREKINVYQNPALKSPAIRKLVLKLNPDLILVSTYHQLIPSSIFSIPSLGTINLHPSLLPKYRGPTPTSWVIMNGEKKTGVTAHYLTKGLDNGPIILQKETKISRSETNGTLRYKLAKLSGRIMAEILQKLRQDSILPSSPQDEHKASYYPRISRPYTYINIDWPLTVLVRYIRGLSPYPGGWLIFNSRKLRILSWQIKKLFPPAKPNNKSITYEDNLMTIKTGDRVMTIKIKREYE